MRGFKFRLASLLSLRQNERDAARRGLADANQALGILENRIAEKDRNLAELKSERGTYLKGAISVDRLLSQGRHEILVEQEKATLQQQVGQIQVELQKRESILQTADQEVKRIEKLRDRALDAYRSEEQTRMQAEMDEVAAVLHQSAENTLRGT
ncbi:flagellar biosynthesis chaperone [Rosistilla carotiformis]|uniref:Flagellar FliJ protein n=1 Tax=Rosistilla carotiformis TaxID=2528017 RepID=A0A518JN48_9BACT|nr:flagellar export protein FliJ [Rosistilla carotiformis]QDV66931.1 flagellar biosynthesis chaperone [Rosistilla carotiformis]